MALTLIACQYDGLCPTAANTSTASGDARDSLHVCCDQGSIGHAAMQYCEQVLGLRMSLQCDIWHRLHNDLVIAVSSSGCARARLDTLHVMKLRRGPFQRAGNLGVLRCAAQLMREEVPEQNPLWDILYAPVMAELGMSERSVDFGTEEHVSRAWREILKVLSTEGIGTNVKTSRWFAWEQRSRKASAHRYQDLLLLMFLGAKRKWWSKWDESPSHSMHVVFDADTEHVVSEEPIHEEEGPADPAPVAAASSSSSAQPAAPRNMSEAKRESVQRRSVCGSALQYCLRVLLHEETCRVWKGLAWIGLPLEEYVGRSQTSCSTPAGAQLYWQTVAKTGLSGVIHAELAHFTSMDMARHLELGSSSNLQAERMTALESRLVHNMWAIVLRLCAELALTSLHLGLPPLTLLGLLSADSASRAAELNNARIAWEAYENLEEVAKSNADASELLRDAMVPHAQLPMELYLRLREVKITQQSTPS
eukprot:6476776-Amphidinium_carterae.4